MSDHAEFLKNTFLFRGMDEKNISALLDGTEAEEKNYSRSETIFSPDDFEHKVGFVMKGECLIGRQSGNNFIPFNLARSGESFGILTAFSVRDEFPTVVKAKGACSVLFFDAGAIRLFAERSSVVSMNIIEFMARKICFLNDKITAFSGGSVEQKLAGYILELKKRNNSLSFVFNKKKSAEALNCGRASLYRAISALENEGYISFDDKKIVITDPEGLERILK